MVAVAGILLICVTIVLFTLFFYCLLTSGMDDDE